MRNKHGAQSAMSRTALAPYSVWSAIFIVVPLFFVAYYAFTDNNFNFTFDRKLEEGRRYEIVLTFASGAVAVQVDPIADWDSKDVEHEFI